MNIVGIIIIVIAVVCVWRGYVRGLFRSVLVAGATILAMVLAAYGTPYVSKALQQYTEIDEKIEQSIIEQFELDIAQGDSTKNEQMLVIDTLPCPEVLKLAVINNNNSDVYEGLNVQNFNEYLAHYMSCIVMNCMAFAIIEFALIVGLFLVLHASKILTEIPVLHGIDKFGGVMLGLLQTLAIIWSLFIVVSLLGNTPLGINAFAQISSNPVLNFLFEHNWLLDKMTSITNVLL